jgi:hypothetical protein
LLFCPCSAVFLMQNPGVRRFCLLLGVLVWAFAVGTTGAETYKLTNGEDLNGELLPASANDAGVQVKVGEGKYEKVPWDRFSQEDLKKFAENKKMAPFVEPFIEITQEEKIKKTEVRIKEPPRLVRPPPQSLFGAFFSSGLGVFVMLLLYAANIYAGYEVSIFRAQPAALVCGVSAVLPLAGPIIFLSMPTRMAAAAPTWEVAPEPGAEAATTPEAVNPMQAESVAQPGGLKLAHTEPEQAKAALPPTTTFQRGQFTFNRRFFETKFAGFFGVVRRDAERDMVLVVKSARGEYVSQRISRIAANDLHLQVQRGNASEEVMIPFQEIQQIQLKHKDA